MTTYIESKLNPDGTYDHSEVIEACHGGAEIEQFKKLAQVWANVKETVKGYATWHPEVKYRAVIEDKPPLTEEDVEKMFTPVPAEVKLQIANSLWDSAKPSVFLAAYIAEKFQSGNAIPVERITLTRAEVNEVFSGLLK